MQNQLKKYKIYSSNQFPMYIIFSTLALKFPEIYGTVNDDIWAISSAE